MSGRRGLRAVVTLFALAALLATAPGAGARSHRHSRALVYWFYQGNLPTSGGARAVRKYNDCCNTTQWIRMSWTNPSHNMGFLTIDYSGNWNTLTAFTSDGYDQYSSYSASFYAQGGCQNPGSLGTVWVNCHEGNTQ
ncbi:MAG TPA: hypothetical protein VF101_09140 [Gaiellaceae bacterium]